MAAEPVGAAQGCVGSWWCRWAGAMLCPVAGQGCVLSRGAVGGEGIFPSFPFPFLLAVPGPQLLQTDSISPFLSWCPQWMMVRKSLLKIPGKGQEPQGFHARLSPHRHFTLAACSHSEGVLCTAVVLPSLSVPSPRLEVFSELHSGHCQQSATALTVTSGGSCPKHPPG